MWDCTSVSKKKNRFGLVKRTMNRGDREEVGKRIRGQAVEELHQDLISWTSGSNSWSDISFLSATMQIHNLDSAARLGFMNHESATAVQQLWSNKCFMAVIFERSSEENISSQNVALQECGVRVAC